MIDASKDEAQMNIISLIITIVVVTATGGVNTNIKEIGGFQSLSICKQAAADYLQGNVMLQGRTTAVCIKKAVSLP